MTEPFACKDCSQLIQYHEGINRVVNVYSGPGGDQGNDHLCPKRIGSDFHHYEVISPKDQTLICHCPDCCFPHYMHMACPMEYDENSEYIGRIEYNHPRLIVKYYLLDWRVKFHSLEVEKAGEDDVYINCGDIHSPEAWRKFAVLQRQVLEEVGLLKTFKSSMS